MDRHAPEGVRYTPHLAASRTEETMRALAVKLP